MVHLPYLPFFTDNNWDSKNYRNLILRFPNELSFVALLSKISTQKSLSYFSINKNTIISSSTGLSTCILPFIRNFHKSLNPRGQKLGRKVRGWGKGLWNNLNEMRSLLISQYLKNSDEKKRRRKNCPSLFVSPGESLLNKVKKS